MIVPSIVRRHFADAEPHLKMLESRVQDAAFSFCNQKGYAYSGRLKTLESLAEKLESGRYSTWESLDDLFGCVIVIPTLQHESSVLYFLRKAFTELETKARGSTKKPPDVFRFDATRFYGTLAPIGTSDPRPLHTTRFEVQIRTAFEHAWSVTTHALAYKTNEVDWKQLRLAAQLKAAVEQLDSLVLAYGAATEPIVEHDWPELGAKQRIVSSFEKLASSGYLAEELIPKNWSRFADNLVSLVRSDAESSKVWLDKAIARALEKLEAEVVSLGADKVPKSVSLLQLAIGVLTRESLLTPPLKSYTPLITEELETFYPETRAHKQRFAFNLPKQAT